MVALPGLQLAGFLSCSVSLLNRLSTILGFRHAVNLTVRCLKKGYIWAHYPDRVTTEKVLVGQDEDDWQSNDEDDQSTFMISTAKKRDREAIMSSIIRPHSAFSTTRASSMAWWGEIPIPCAE